MSKNTQAIYLLIIVVLVSAIASVWLGDRALVATAEPPVRIAVFDFIASNPDSKAVARSLKTELVALLENNDTFEIIPDSELLPYSSDTHEGWSDDLMVGVIVEGSVRVREDRLRLSAQLMDGVTDAHVWSKSYEGDLDGTDSFVGDLYEGIRIAANRR